MCLSHPLNIICVRKELTLRKSQWFTGNVLKDIMQTLKDPRIMGLWVSFTFCKHSVGHMAFGIVIRTIIVQTHSFGCWTFFSQGFFIVFSFLMHCIMSSEQNTGNPYKQLSPACPKHPSQLPEDRPKIVSEKHSSMDNPELVAIFTKIYSHRGFVLVLWLGLVVCVPFWAPWRQGTNADAGRKVY